ncbi:hypothetical protein DV738_g431, partial [Chaetothyriales sp. CBS 135597]
MDDFTTNFFASGGDEDSPTPSDHDDRDVQLHVIDAEAESSPSPNHDITDKAAANVNLHQESAVPMEKQSLQDRLLARLLQQVIPDDAVDDHASDSDVHVYPPTFSLPLMTNNFRRFNARIGIVFGFQDQVVHLFSWQHPSHTLSFLATYSFVCLNPYLIIALPLAITLLFIMVPAFLSRHPPPPPQAKTSSTTPYYSTFEGPALAPAPTIKPASETSVDFFRNIRYLQNSMADFSGLYDLLNSTITPATNFSDEILSSTIFISLFLLTLCLFITAHLLPWRLIALVGGNAAIVSLHPACKKFLQTLQAGSSPQSEAFDPLSHVPPKLQPIVSSVSSITLSSAPETREVEIFELQHRALSSAEWQPYLFTPAPYDPLSPARISGDRPKGTRFFEDVQPPEGWEFHTKTWELDLNAGEWVNERLVVGVEYDIHSGGGQSSSSADFGGWVWDLPPAPGQAGQDEEAWLVYGGDYDLSHHDVKQTPSKAQEYTSEKDWEESVRSPAPKPLPISAQTSAYQCSNLYLPVLKPLPTSAQTSTYQCSFFALDLTSDPRSNTLAMQNPSVTLNTPSQSRQQVPLRDYLNVRIAPFLKKGLTESLDKEPEYPLQWLGEYLINQSILFEGNTEAEKLKEHFRYTFPLPQQPESGYEWCGSAGTAGTCARGDRNRNKWARVERDTERKQ